MCLSSNVLITNHFQRKTVQCACIDTMLEKHRGEAKFEKADGCIESDTS